MALFNLDNPEQVAVPPFYFHIGTSKYAFVQLATPGISEIVTVLMFETPGGYEIIANGTSVDQQHFDMYGGIAGFVQWHLDRWNPILTQRHSGEEVETLFQQLANFLSNNVQVTNGQMSIKQ